MNRTIKFRAWDGKEKHFVYFELYQGANNHTPPIYNWAELEPWQEFTGLLDKNGKEIYEGDVIERWSYTSENLGRQDVERFPVKYFGDTGYPAFDLEGNESEANGLSELNDSGEWEYEIIGNIFENSDLLV